MIVAVVLLVCVALTTARPPFKDRIPNGHDVMDPCDRNIHWNAVGHINRDNGGLRNPFGSAFAAQGHSWTPALCAMDSDGDGVSNGAELGDPNCTWQPGQFPEFDALRHPGINEKTWTC